jgi:hypothetical protein
MRIGRGSFGGNSTKKWNGFVHGHQQINRQKLPNKYIQLTRCTGPIFQVDSSPLLFPK